MRIFLHNTQRRFKLDTVAFKRLADTLATLAQARCLGELAWQEVSIHLLDDARIAQVNKIILAHEGSTDVITQRYETLPGEPEGLIGELFVNVECAVRVAPRRKGWSADHELALYLAHGFDHLTGSDDCTVSGRALMRRRELDWLRRIRLTPLYLTANLINNFSAAI